MRYIAALVLLLSPAVSLAEWSDKDRVEHYAMCRQAGGSQVLCACAIKTLEEIQPVCEKVTGDNIGEAVRACALPPPSKDELRI